MVPGSFGGAVLRPPSEETGGRGGNFGMAYSWQIFLFRNANLREAGRRRAMFFA